MTSCGAEGAAKHGLLVVGSYTNQGISGASLIRPGIQKLLQDGDAGKFEIILTESLDRVSRDQEDIAHIHKRMRFLGIKIFALSDGDVNELHIGLKGTMGALYLKDLADKTRRGLRGRIEAGKSGGGNTYGYDVVKTIDANSEPVRGERRINPSRRRSSKASSAVTPEASPRAVAKQLNREGVPGPSGKGWGPSTIHGNWQRGTGVLNNELYIGKQVWNACATSRTPRPGSGSRASIPIRMENRLRARAAGRRPGSVGPGQGTATDAAREPFARQRARILGPATPEIPIHRADAVRVCGGGGATWNRLYIGCVNARSKGTCTNTHHAPGRARGRRARGLQHRLMDPDLMALFCEEYTRHMNALTREHNAAREGARVELTRVNRDLERLVQALLDGAPPRTVKDRMAQLEARKEVLDAQLAQGEDVKSSVHPSMGRSLSRARGQPARSIDKRGLPGRERGNHAHPDRQIVLMPVCRDGKATLSITLRGDLGGILGLAAEAKGPLDASDPVVECTKLVAGLATTYTER